MFGLLSRTPIRLKLIFFFSLVLLSVSIFNFSYYPKVYKKQALINLEGHANTMAEMIALSTGISMELMDFASIGIAINWGKKDPRLAYLGIFDTENDEIGIFNPHKLDLDISSMLKRKNFFELEQSIYISVPINYLQTNHGNLLLGISLDALNAEIKDNQITTLYISLGVLSLGILISIVLSNMITKPLIQLTQATREVARGKYDVAIEIKSGDEVGKLGGDFQIMVGKINQAMEENKRINKQLESVVQDLTETGTALSAEKDIEKLLDIILSSSRSISKADAGTLYFVEEDHLVFKIVQNDTLNVNQGGASGNAISFKPAQIQESHVSGYVVLNRTTVNIEDVYTSDLFDFTGPKAFDKAAGYHSQSMLVIPLINRFSQQVVGVLQIMNATDSKTGEVIPFSPAVETLIQSLASQAAVAITNLRLKENTEKLLDEVTQVKNYNESILESLSHGVITLDSQNNISKYNYAAQYILKIDLDELVGHPLGEYLSAEDHWILDSVKTVMQTNNPKVTMDTEIRFSGKEKIPLNFTVAPLKNAQNNVIGSLLILEDITMEKRMKGTLTRFMTKEVAEKLLEGGEAVLGGQMQEAAVMFSDIRGFTSIAEKLSAQETVALLNEYFTLMVDIVFEYGGILDKYIGDAMLAVFGAPFKGIDDSDRAVNSAIDMIRELKAFNIGRQKNSKVPIDIGIGINTEEILAGNIGSLKRMDYTIIGDGVNLASRLEGVNKYFGSKILISENTFFKLKNNYLCREIDRIRVKGKERAVAIYEILNFHDEQSFPQMDDCLGIFQEGLEVYRQQNWKEGVKKFNSILALNSKDKVSKIYADRCQYMMENPPGEDWDGVWVMTSK